MEWTQIGANLAAIVVVIGSLLGFLWTRIDKKFESLMQEIKEIKTTVQSIEIKVSRLETQDEERFRNEIKLLVSERKRGNES